MNNGHTHIKKYTFLNHSRCSNLNKKFNLCMLIRKMDKEKNICITVNYTHFIFYRSVLKEIADKQYYHCIPNM